MKKAKLFSLKYRDLFKGFVVSIFTVLVTGLYNVVKDGNWPSINDWRMMALAAISAGLSYLIKNWLTNSEDQLLKKEPESPYKRDL